MPEVAGAVAAVEALKGSAQADRWFPGIVSGDTIAALAIEHDLWVLSDEAYFEMRYEGESRSIAALPGIEFIAP